MSHIFLYGPSGSGKSTIGQKLAHDLRLPFVDSDQCIEENAGISIPKIVEEQGMEKVRELETEVLKQIVNGRECVVALGGGALLRDENRVLIEKNGKVILLAAEISTLIERLQNDPNERPLLAGDLKTKLAAYLESRAEHYDSFSLKVRVDGKSVEQISREIQTLLGRHHLSAMGEYDVVVDDVSNLKNVAMQSSIFVTDENVAKFHLEKMQASLNAKSVIVPAGEEYKNLETISFLWKSFLENGLDRQSTVIALGGGVIGDMAGFAASTYMRGIDWVAVPTTLLSMVDASIGGKTGFDLPEGKNLIGSFYPPKLVLVDVEFLRTLPEAEFISGMAEVVKHGIISDPELFTLCGNGLDWVKNHLEEIVKRAMAVKIKIIEEDPYEKGVRAALNLGHTVGHAVELVSKFKLRHGEAVSIGMAAEAQYAEKIAVAARGLSDAVAGSLLALGLPVRIPENLPREEIIRAMSVDKKKNAKSVRFALPSAIGRVELVDVADLESVLDV
jgi:3-dehydroquinate synthase